MFTAPQRDLHCRSASFFGIISISIHELFEVAHQTPLQTSNYRLPRSVFSTRQIFQSCQPFKTAATNMMHYGLSLLFDFRPFVTFLYRFHLSIDLYFAQNNVMTSNLCFSASPNFAAPPTDPPNSSSTHATVDNQHNSDLCQSLQPVDQQVQISKLNHVKPCRFHFEPFNILTVTHSYRKFRRKNSSASNFLINFDASLLTSPL
ncbi:hypothetical protein B0H14DRAFT_2630231 [Mycena olivaceomarginata]|nr:hypothetical protein B0H14DRAFT_2630231 [Mycena olivaceomarginata]